VAAKGRRQLEVFETYNSQHIITAESSSRLKGILRGGNMAFYAEVYGFIATKKGQNISLDIADEIAASTPIFKSCFSNIFDGKTLSYVPFACNVKFDEGEDAL
jgi:hypothetical protein